MEFVLWIRFEEQLKKKKIKGDEKKTIKHVVYTYLLYIYSLLNLNQNPEQ